MAHEVQTLSLDLVKTKNKNHGLSCSGCCTIRGELWKQVSSAIRGAPAMHVLIAHLRNLLKNRHFTNYFLFFTWSLESSCCHAPESSLKSLFHGMLHTVGIQRTHMSAEAGGGVWSCQGAREQTRSFWEEQSGPRVLAG